MNGFLEWCILFSAIVSYVNLWFLCIIEKKLREIKSEISRLKKQKGGE